MNPYAAYPNTLQIDYSSVGGSRSTPDLNLNPPLLLPYFQLLSRFSLVHFVIVQTLVTALCFAFGTILIVSSHPRVQGRQIFWVLSSVPTIGAIIAGQTYGGLFLLAAMAFYFERRCFHVWASIAIGLVVAIKPTMIFWPLLLYIAGHHKLAVRAIAVAIIAFSIPLLIYGPATYGQWLSALADDPHWIDPKDIALVPLFARLGHRQIGMAAAIVAGIAIAYWGYRKKPVFTNASGAGISAGILCAPLGWSSYVLILAPFFVSRPWTTVITIAASIFLIPFPLHVTQQGPAYLASILLMLCFFMMPNFRRITERPFQEGEGTFVQPIGR
jgi:Protein of unknown function (DUF2029).